MGDKLEESSEAHGPSSLMHATVSNKTEVLSQTMCKGETNTHSCPMNFSCVPWHVCACTLTNVHECNIHIQQQQQQNMSQAMSLWCQWLPMYAVCG